jgi:ABC-2 type transport system permease protein
LNRRRTLAVTKRVLRGLRHDRRSMAMMLVAPIMAMFVFGIAFSGDVTDVTVAVVQGDSPFVFTNNTTLEFGAALVGHLDARKLSVRPAPDEAAARAMVERGEARAALVIPPYFTRDVVLSLFNGSYRGNTTVKLMLDRSNVNVAGTIEGEVASSMRFALEGLGHAPAVLDDTDPVYGRDAKFADFLIPGIMTFAVFLLTNLLTITGFVQERLSGTLDRLGASPLTPGEMVLGYSAAYSLVAMLQAAILVTVAILAFHISIVGSVLLAFLIVALLSVASQALGILLSAGAKTEAQAVQVVPFLILPVFLLSGIFWPVEAIPPELRPFSWAMPTTYAVEGLRSVMVRGWGLDRVWPHLLALALFASAFLALARTSLARSRR